MNYKMILAYDGARYDGWQKQGNTERTIQGKLEAALGRLTGETVELQGAGRTDAGVHARGQAASFHLASERDCRELLEELNRYLPEDLAVLSLERAPERFHARLNALEKGTATSWPSAAGNRCLSGNTCTGRRNLWILKPWSRRRGTWREPTISAPSAATGG